MSDFIIRLCELSAEPLELVGGKARNLGALIRAGIPVPYGFCITTSAFRGFVDTCPEIDGLHRRLECADPDDVHTMTDLGTEFRAALADAPMPEDVHTELIDTWRQFADDRPCAVRSSATAEDLLAASFAGQYDTFLNVRGEQQLVDRVRECWLSVFTDRAIDYRSRRGIPQRDVELAVVVQTMVESRAAGVMFTADPVTGHRRVVVINAAYGLGESVVSGSVNPDLYSIGANGTVHKSISTKSSMTVPETEGGIVIRDIPTAQRREQALPDNEIHQLAALGRRIESHFGAPQDIEWAWTGTELQVLQARPITSLFPMPEPPKDGRLHLYFSLGHQQMMTEAITPLGQSTLRTYFPFGRRRPTGESSQMVTAGSRVYFDYTEPLHSPLPRRVLAWAVGTMDARVGAAIRGFADRADFREGHRTSLSRELAMNAFVVGAVARIAADLCWSDLTDRHADVLAFAQDTLTSARAAVEPARGADRIAAVQADLRKQATPIFYRLILAPVAALVARRLVERLCLRWLGDTQDVAALDKAVPGNVTTEMGLVIADLADLTRDRPELVQMLAAPPEPFEMSMLDTVPGGPQFRTALAEFLDRYGMRGPGEIDIARARWGEQPTVLFTSILANTHTSRPGEHHDRFRAGEREAAAAVERILERVRATRAGRLRVRVMSRLIYVHRTLMALREHQKFLSVRLFDIYRRAIRAETETLVAANILASVSDADYLSLDELRRMLTGWVPADLAGLLATRRADFEAAKSLVVPRLFTSDGEVVPLVHAGEHAEGVLVGSPVSAGVVEGRARIVLRPQDAKLTDGDILVAPFADPAWTPLFSAVRGLVLEVGGVMAHGAVVARELGLPAVVGIDDATKLIVDGERIRVDGSLGVVESLEPAPATSIQR